MTMVDVAVVAGYLATGVLFWLEFRKGDDLEPGPKVSPWVILLWLPVVIWTLAETPAFLYRTSRKR